jgi:hypothetical protein
MLMGKNLLQLRELFGCIHEGIADGIVTTVELSVEREKHLGKHDELRIPSASV